MSRKCVLLFLVLALILGLSACRSIRPNDVSKRVPVITSFNADPISIAVGESSTLSWSVSDATRVTISYGIGDVALAGTRVVSPLETTTYTLTAQNKAGSAYASTTIQVQTDVNKPSAYLKGDIEYVTYISGNNTRGRKHL